jgi:hypothetical protein
MKLITTLTFFIKNGQQAFFKRQQNLLKDNPVSGTGGLER